MVLANPTVQKMLKSFLLSQVGIALKNMFWSALFGKLSNNNNPSQSGEAGAVPAPDPAPWTGGPHEDPTTNNTPGGMADVANGEMNGGHGSNGTSYNNDER